MIQGLGLGFSALGKSVDLWV